MTDNSYVNLLSCLVGFYSNSIDRKDLEGAYAVRMGLHSDKEGS